MSQPNSTNVLLELEQLNTWLIERQDHVPTHVVAVQRAMHIIKLAQCINEGIDNLPIKPKILLMQEIQKIARREGL